MQLNCFKLLGLLALLAFGSFVFGCDFETSMNYVVVPGQSVGLITPSTTRADLDELFGSTNVVDTNLVIGEGFYEKGTVVFPSDASKKLEIFWQDVSTKLKPATVRVTSDSETTVLWKVNNGIAIGTDLKTVEKINKKPFKLYGFSWDYGGTVSTWNGGELDKQKGLSLVFAPADGDYKRTEKVIGDSEFSSSFAPMKRLNPTVVQMSIFLNDSINSPQFEAE